MSKVNQTEKMLEKIMKF